MDFADVSAALAIARVSEESGIPEEFLTTHSRIYKPHLQQFPYCEMVCPAPDLSKDDPMYHRWEDYLWRKHFGGKKR